MSTAAHAAARSLWPWSRKRNAAPAQDPGSDGGSLPEAIALAPPMWPPLTAPASLATLGWLADGLRAMDGPPGGSRDYREVRAGLDTAPLQAVPGDETPGWTAHYLAGALSPRPLPGLAADLADLPAFREAVRGRTRCHAGQCRCGQDITGDTWGGRMVSAGSHLLGGAA